MASAGILNIGWFADVALPKLQDGASQEGALAVVIAAAVVPLVKAGCATAVAWITRRFIDARVAVKTRQPPGPMP